MIGDINAKTLDGMACDLLETSCLVEPLKFVPADAQELLSPSAKCLLGMGLEQIQLGKILQADRNQFAYARFAITS